MKIKNGAVKNQDTWTKGENKNKQFVASQFNMMLVRPSMLGILFFTKFGVLFWIHQVV